MISIYLSETYFLTSGSRSSRFAVGMYGGLLMMKSNGPCSEINCIVSEEIKKEKYWDSSISCFSSILRMIIFSIKSTYLEDEQGL